jgi:catechol 2,3-dioxygenase-like lactoylglutathione lyase family enzyme
MNVAMLEHVNITVSDPEKTAAMLCELFGWHLRWQGASIDQGRTVHVGTDTAYVAVYTNPKTSAQVSSSYTQCAGLNHIGVVVEDLDEAEQRILGAGYKTFNHADYEPGRRFYFNDHDDVEYEVVCYG